MFSSISFIFNSSDRCLKMFWGAADTGLSSSSMYSLSIDLNKQISAASWKWFLPSSISLNFIDLFFWILKHWGRFLDSTILGAILEREPEPESFLALPVVGLSDILNSTYLGIAIAELLRMMFLGTGEFSVMGLLRKAVST